MYAYRPDREFHDVYGNQYLLLGERMLRNGAVLQSPYGCSTVAGCRLDGDRLIIEFQRGRLEYRGVREGPRVQNQ